MIVAISSAYEQILGIGKEYPFIGGAASLWALSVGTYLLKNVPRKIANLVSGQFVTSLYLNNNGSYNEPVIYLNFSSWLVTNNKLIASRALSLGSKCWENEIPVIGVGYGTHIFTNRGRLFWFNKAKVDSSGGSKQKEEVTIFTLGRSRTHLEQLVIDFTPKMDENNIPFFVYSGFEWRLSAQTSVRSLDSVVLGNHVKESVIAILDDFYADSLWYTEKGFPYKLTCVLHGPPGTGKTSFIRAIAGKYKRPIYSMSLSGMTDTSLQSAIAGLPKGCICLMEDFDDCAATRIGRENLNPTITLGKMEDFGMGSLNPSVVLNSLDGIIGLDGVVIFMTTNHLDVIDPALLRKGRVDHEFLVPPLGDADIKKYLKYAFPAQDTNATFDTILGCDLASLYLQNKNNFENLVASIPLARNPE